MLLECSIPDRRLFLERLAGFLTARDHTLFLGEEEVPLGSLPPGDPGYIGVQSGALMLLQVFDDALEIVTPAAIPLLEPLIAEGVIQVDAGPAASAEHLREWEQVSLGEAAEVRPTPWGTLVLPKREGAAPFLLGAGTRPGTWRLLVPGMDWELPLEPGEASDVVRAIAAGRIRQGRERTWIEWTRIELPHRFLYRQRGSGCLGFGGRRTAEVVTWEPYG